MAAVKYQRKKKIRDGGKQRKQRFWFKLIFISGALK